ncbi:MAG: YHS domain-containing protein [Anaerolineales bacterium]
MLKDPVCGKRMNRGKPYSIVNYEGVAYSLCCARCQAEFESMPKNYALPELGRRVKNKKRLPHRRQ